MSHSASRAKKLIFGFFHYLMVSCQSCIFCHALSSMHASTETFLRLKVTSFYVIDHIKFKYGSYELFWAPIGHISPAGGFCPPSPSMESERPAQVGLTIYSITMNRIDRVANVEIFLFHGYNCKALPISTPNLTA